MIDARLRAFISVAENLSFTKAAGELLISQPAVSKHIKELEAEYNTALFERRGSHVRLTEAGAVLLSHARRVLEEYRQLDAGMDALRPGTRGVLRLGASTTIAQYVLPEMLAEFRRKYPEIALTLSSGNSREVEAELFRGTIDLGMVEGASRRQGLKYTPFMKDELVAIAGTAGALGRHETLSAEELRHIPIVLREYGSGTLDVVQQALRKLGMKLSELNIEMNIGSTEGIKNYVAHSDAAGIVSIRSVSGDIYRNVFRIIDIEGLHMEREFQIAERSGESTGLAGKFKEFITESYRR